MLLKKNIWRVLGDLAILFVTSTFLLGYVSLVIGLAFAIILSFISINDRFYSKNFILKNIKYILIKNIIYTSYVVIIWLMYDYNLSSLLHGLWIGIIYTITFIYIYNRIYELEVSK